MHYDKREKLHYDKRKNCIMINGKKLHYDKRGFKVAGGGLAAWNKKMHYDKREKFAL